MALLCKHYRCHWDTGSKSVYSVKAIVGKNIVASSGEEIYRKYMSWLGYFYFPINNLEVVPFLGQHAKLASYIYVLP